MSELKEISKYLWEFDFGKIETVKYPVDTQDCYGIFVRNCTNIHDLIENQFISINFNRSNLNFILKIECTNSNFCIPKEIEKWMQKFTKNLLIISIENSGRKTQIFWKFQTDRIFWIEIGIGISNFVLNTLASSMKTDDHFGISEELATKLNLTNQNSELDLVVLTNSKGQNLLMIASEIGDTDAVSFLLQSNFDVNEKLHGKMAVDFAWNNKHFNIVLLLMKANSRFPSYIDIDTAPVELKIFVDTAKELQKFIMKRNSEEIEKILSNNVELRHFYSMQNISAPAFALINKKYEAYEFLVKRNVYICPKEDINEIIKHVSQNQRENLKMIHLKCMKSFGKNYLEILEVNSSIGQNDLDADLKLFHIKKYFEYVDSVHPFISLILQITAASRDFKIVFNSNRKSVQRKDLESVKKYREMLNTSRKIHIAAGDFANMEQSLDVHGLISYELCLYAILLVYRNRCRPYYYNDQKNKGLYEKAIANCELNRKSDELIDTAFNNEPELLHAELIARVPQMIVKYSKDEEKMKQCRENFPDLFKFCEKTVATEMQKKLPNIKSRAEEKVQKFKKSNKRQGILLAIMIAALPFAVWMAIFFTSPQIEPFYDCGNLTDDLRGKIFASTVEFQGVNVIFGDLFGRNTSACEHLSSSEINNMLKVFDSGELVENYTGVYVNFTAVEHTNIYEIKDDLVTTELKFFLEKNKNKNKHINDIKNISMKYRNLKFREPSLKIDNKVKFQTKFYVERRIDPKVSKFVIRKLMLLSDLGGSGKSTYFRHMVWNLKRLFPLKWISYIDLKQHIKALEQVPRISSNLTIISNFLSTKILNLTSNVEREVFVKKYSSNDALFFWDGVDEVSPNFLTEIMRLIELVSETSGSHQWISTRPHLEGILSKQFKPTIFGLENYNEIEINEFITKCLESENIKVENITKVINEFKEFSNRLSTMFTNDPMSFPYIIHMMCQSYSKNSSWSDFKNLYKFYDNHFNQVYNNVYDNGEITKKDTLKISEEGLFRKIHQHFAVKYYRNTYDIYNQTRTLNISALEIAQDSPKFKDQEYLRYGIVYKFRNSTMFEHRTYCYFFTAQYLYENIWDELSGSPRDDEADLRLQFLFFILNKTILKQVSGDFIIGFTEAFANDTVKSFNKVIKKLMMTKYYDLLDYIGYEVFKLKITTSFFKKDQDVIKKLWKVGENRSYFHQFIEPPISFDEYTELRRIIDETFSQEDAKEIYEGKHQAANILRIIWQKRANYMKNVTNDLMNVTNLKYDIESVRKITTFGKFMTYFETQDFTKTEIREFLIATSHSKVLMPPKNREIFQNYTEKVMKGGDFDDVQQYLILLD